MAKGCIMNVLLQKFFTSVTYSFVIFIVKVYMYKAISGSLENYKIINCIVFSIILNYIIFIIKL